MERDQQFWHSKGMGKERKGKGEPGGLAIIEVLREVHSLAKTETREEDVICSRGPKRVPKSGLKRIPGRRRAVI